MTLARSGRGATRIGALGDAASGTGRFALAYRDEGAASTPVSPRYAAFSGFSWPEASGESGVPLDVHHDYGRVGGPDGGIECSSSAVESNLCAPPPAALATRSRRERASAFSFDAYYVDGSLGRGEVLVQGGDLDAPVRMNECWSSSLERTSYRVQAGGMMTEMVSSPRCGLPASLKDCCAKAARHAAPNGST